MIKKIICVLVLLSLILSTSACGGNKGNKDKTGDAQSYYYEETKLGGDSGMIDPGDFKINSQNQLVFYDWGVRGSLKYVILNSEGKPAGNINVDVSCDGSVFTLDNRDNLYVAAILKSSETQGDQKLYIVDKTGKITKTVDLGKADLNNEKDSMPVGVKDITIGSDGNIYLADPSKGIIVLDKDGNPVKTFGSQGVIKLSNGKDNVLYVGYNTRGDGNYVEKLNASNGKSLWKVNFDNRKRYENMVYSPYDDNIYLLGEEGIDKIDAAGNQPGTVLTFSEYTILGAGSFIPVIGVDSTKNIYAISVTPPEDSKSGGEDPNLQVKVPYNIFKYTLKSGTKADDNKKIITAVVRRSERYLQTAVSLFQKNNPDYKIKLEYMDSAQNNESYIQNLNTSILAGKGMDILQTSRLPYDKYISKGILVDLNELIAKDKNFDINQYYTNILDGVKINGHMYFMPTIFTFNALMANKGILDEVGVTIDSSNWTWNDFKKAAEKVVQKDGDGNVIRTALPNVSPSDLLNYFVMLGDFSKFVDMNKKTSSFDSPDFKEMLELIKSFGNNNLTSKGNVKRNMGDVTEAAYRGAVVFVPEPVQSYIDYGIAKSMFKGKVSVLSFPSGNASGSNTFNANETYGIASYSKYKDAAWEFIKTLISEEIQSNMQVGGFTVNKAAQKNSADQAIEETSHGIAKMNMAGKEFNIDKITQEDVNYIDSMIPKLNKYFSMDNQVMQIVIDEAAAYFSGDKSVEETAKLIQNRIYIYLNE